MSDLTERLKRELERNAKIYAWELRRTRTHAVQIYLVGTRLEAERRVDDERHAVTVHVRHDDVQGEATLRFLPGEESTVSGRLEEAVYMATLGGEEPFEPCGPADVPAVALLDPELGEDKQLETARRLSREWAEAAGAVGEGARPSSGELFCEAETVTQENSAGFRASEERSRLSLLTIMLAQRGDREAERISWEERGRSADLDVGALVRQAADEARDLTRAGPPRSGAFAVVIDAGEFGALFGPIVQQASGEAIYEDRTRLEPGKPLPIEGSGGDRITLASNPELPFGLSSYSFDGDGVPSRRVEIVREGVFARPWLTKRYADYTRREATGAFGNLEIAAGDATLEELLHDGPVLYVHRFSWLTPDGMRGDFASEVRLGYWCENGVRTPIKGGSVAGNLFTALGAARFSKETVFLGDYLGPRAVRFEGVTVTGV
jgi:PmbA protein